MKGRKDNIMTKDDRIIIDNIKAMRLGTMPLPSEAYRSLPYGTPMANIYEYAVNICPEIDVMDVCDSYRAYLVAVRGADRIKAIMGGARS